MDFFKSVFADEHLESSDSDEPQNDDVPAPESPPDSNSSTPWSFGGLIKTLATKSESVIQTYRKDLEEFGSGLRMESAVIRDAASRAVKDLPASLEVGATVAQESLESVGQAIDDIGSSVWKSTAEIISQGRDSLLAAADEDSDASESNSRQLSGRPSFDSKPYSRFEAQLRAMQSNASTYLDDPEDLGNYELWKSGFGLDERKEETENLMKRENGEIGEIYETLVPNSVDHENFWFRYFYKVHKLKEFEDARAKLVKRAISGEEEELSWDFDDEDEDEEEDNKAQEKLQPESESASASDNVDKPEAAKSAVVSEAKASESSDSCKDSDVSIVSRPEEEEDLEWDEIGDIGSNDESKAVGGGSGETSSRADLRKRMSNAAEDDEDLSWDIEEDVDDEQPKKS
ncbi:hypothetical protein L484_011308 [Morus notabilis]|uniref:BSD domain-containing protein n=1 Tax=Morus notabilis TaxID=981085 RepID=W9S082_9ROSA|nr:BSD domain-containing protein 1 [Morus notabilis]EXC05727.1 hypothetical protein L484_011308 [Morus notabilis]